MMSLDRAREIYREVRDLAPFASEEWTESYNVDEGVAEICIPDRLTGEVKPIAQVLTACPHDDRVMMQKAPIYVGALLTLLREAFRRIEEASPKKKPQPAAKAPDKNRYAKACAILSGKQPFRSYLSAVHALEAVDDERVNTRVRSILNIQSRNELDTDPNARERWFSLVRDFQGWEKHRR